MKYCNKIWLFTLLIHLLILLIGISWYSVVEYKEYSFSVIRSLINSYKILKLDIYKTFIVI
jgi:hypothetical protein